LSHWRKPAKIAGWRYKKLSLGGKAALKTVLTIPASPASSRQAFHIVRQGGDTNRAVRSQTLYLAQISHLRGAHHQHGVTP
jgi:hypothetical protein